MAQIARLFRTLQHLKLSQLFYQFLVRLQRYEKWAKPRLSEHYTSGCCRWEKGLNFARPSGTSACEGLKPYRFKFINLSYTFGSHINWNGAPYGKLWNYNLHYFEWIWGLGPDEAKKVVQDWIQRHEHSSDAEGWEPYPLSLRIGNWLAYWGSVGRASLEEDPQFRDRLFESLGLQCDWLSRRLEKHILGNHYFENGFALWMAGSFFEHKVSKKWLSIGKQILEQELREQLLADGMHFECSPMYHNRFLHLLSWLKLIDAQNFDEAYKAAKVAALNLQHPDGKIALFNDSAFGIYPEVEGDGELGAFSMRSSGYYGVRNDRGDYLICDAGRIGPNYITGHSHCDVGSFELSVGGHRLITDTGVYHYLNTDERHYSRATIAHNVFAPEGCEQAEMWSAFRVGDRPDVQVQEWDHSAKYFHLVVTHNGFEKSGVTVERSFDFDAAGQLKISDRYTANQSTRMVGHLHLAPNVVVTKCSATGAQLKIGSRSIQIVAENVDSLSVRRSDYYPEFNTTVTRSCLDYVVQGRSGCVALKIQW